MPQSNPKTPRSLLTFTLVACVVGFLGFQVASLFQPSEQMSAEKLNCEEPSVKPRLACVSHVGPSDARPLPPQG